MATIGSPLSSEVKALRSQAAVSIWNSVSAKFEDGIYAHFPGDKFGVLAPELIRVPDPVKSPARHITESDIEAFCQAVYRKGWTIKLCDTYDPSLNLRENGWLNRSYTGVESVDLRTRFPKYLDEKFFLVTVPRVPTSPGVVEEGKIPGAIEFMSKIAETRNAVVRVLHEQIAPDLARALAQHRRGEVFGIAAPPSCKVGYSLHITTAPDLAALCDLLRTEGLEVEVCSSQAARRDETVKNRASLMQSYPPYLLVHHPGEVKALPGLPKL